MRLLPFLYDKTKIPIFLGLEFFGGRDEIAGCSEKAYDSLSIKDARQMLLFSSDQELSDYINEVKIVARIFSNPTITLAYVTFQVGIWILPCKMSILLYHGLYFYILLLLLEQWYLVWFWNMQEHPEWEIKNGFVFFQRSKESMPCKEIPSLQLINQTLSYARELERIVWVRSASILYLIICFNCAF